MKIPTSLWEVGWNANDRETAKRKKTVFPSLTSFVVSNSLQHSEMERYLQAIVTTYTNDDLLATLLISGICYTGQNEDSGKTGNKIQCTLLPWNNKGWPFKISPPNVLNSYCISMGSGLLDSHPKAAKNAPYLNIFSLWASCRQLDMW